MGTNVVRVLRIAWRNLWRNKRRTLISMSAVALGLTLVLVYGSIVARMLSEAKDQLDNTGLGHVEITATGWREHRSTKLAIADPDAAIAKLALPPTAEVGKRVLVRGLLSGAHGNAAVEVHGVDWRDEAKLSDYVRHVSGGALPADDDKSGVLLGDALAKKLDVGVGNKVRLMVQRADGEMGADLLRVRGIYHAVSSSISEHRVLVSRKALADLVGIDENAAHDIVIQLDRAADAAPLAERARATLGADVHVATYAELYPMFETMEKLTGTIITVASFFVYFLVGLGILNTILMSVLERTRELGVMQALGTRPSGVVALVLAESFWIATLSVVVGLAIGVSVMWFFQTHTLLDYSKQMGESIDVGGAVMRSTFSTELRARDIVGPCAFVYVMAVVVGIYPALRITRLHVVEALHAK